MQTILSDSPDKLFIPFDRFAQFENSKGKTLIHLLDEFAVWRRQNIHTLQQADLHAKDLHKKGVHPEFGPVTLRQLLAAWTTHDMAHISQIARIMAKQYKEEAGPWIGYISILRA